jgi:hypothetical protein
MTSFGVHVTGPGSSDLMVLRFPGVQEAQLEVFSPEVESSVAHG